MTATLPDLCDRCGELRPLFDISSDPKWDIHVCTACMVREIRQLRDQLATAHAERDDLRRGLDSVHRFSKANLERAEIAEAAVVTARRDAWDEGFECRDSYVSASRMNRDYCGPNPYRARASTQITKHHVFDWREDIMGNYVYRCCDKGQTDPVHQVSGD